MRLAGYTNEKQYNRKIKWQEVFMRRLCCTETAENAADVTDATQISKSSNINIDENK